MGPDADILILGAGAAGLSLASHLAQRGVPGRIVIVDRDWSPGRQAWATWFATSRLIRPREPLFRAVRVWASGRERVLSLDPFRYGVVTKAELLADAELRMHQHGGFHQLTGEVREVVVEGQVARVRVDDSVLAARLVFDSRAPDRADKPLGWLSFVGWHVEAASPVFDPDVPTLMDFRVPAEGGVTFVYVLPTSPTSALVEYTRFAGAAHASAPGAAPPAGGTAGASTTKAAGPEVVGAEGSEAEVAAAEVARAEVAGADMADAAVARAEVAGAEVADAAVARAEVALRGYLAAVLRCDDYRVVARERGALPLASPVPRQASGPLLDVGTRGGRLKPSTGYAFDRIQRDSAAVAASLRRWGHPFDLPCTARRHAFMDEVLLTLVRTDPERVEEAFDRLFLGASAAPMLRFLDEDTTLLEDLRLIAPLPPLPFLLAAFRTAGSAAATGRIRGASWCSRT